MVENSKSTQLVIRVPNETLAKVKDMAKAERRTLAAMAKLLIEDAIELRSKGHERKGKK